ncbi:type II toxin-antitoxin system HipA family toxin [Emticicia sp. CRIBPO]|uniref:type II toxin-antitoxin system HipA family toxin n=1 Tax=Emticicia sp. CRIBPO TaxID=2683258 RepID=UPI001411EF0A|nr:type II toxin-antitoxin system HipA family toxin [Emticicia sp. CRIBPO]NBA84868.1 type II toxin-antitoxin system HipA family toxin [Emticicia sp. CRIBPO]
MYNIKVVEVRLSNVTVGRIALTADRHCVFEYDPDYLKTGISIAPFYLPLRAELFTARSTPFDRNFGVFSDSLPDGWGSLLLDRYLQENGIDPYKLSTLDRLSIIGTSGRGALEYFPDHSTAIEESNVSLNKLAQEAERILNSDYSASSIDMLYRYGGSSGGARPKVFVKIDGEEWLVKFKAAIDPDNVGEVEYQYSLLAGKCGIEMPETKLFEGKYFGVRRFDRTNGNKIHTISAAGLLNADYRIPSLDYSMLLNACFQLTLNMEEVYNLYRVMVFNILIKNRDDHAKNFSFILKDGTWRLSPAYDLLPGGGFNGYHTTTLNGKGEPGKKDIFDVADSVGLQKKKYQEIYDEISDHVSNSGFK